MYSQEEADLLREVGREKERADCAESEVAELRRQLAKEEERTSECQREIGRLRGIVREYNRIEEAIKKPDYEKLFELWRDFDDDDSPAEVKAKCGTLMPFDEASFLGFCAGFAAAGKILNGKM